MQYIVKSGDTLSSIAQKFYGSASRYPEIVSANPIIENADRIETGWVLEIPGASQLPERPVAVPPTIHPVPPPPAPAAAGSNKTMMIVLVLASLALGYMLVKHLASKKDAPKEEPAPEPVREPVEEV